MEGRAAGVVLASGERVIARVVAANVGPKLLFRDLVPEGAVEPEVRRTLHGMKTGSGTFRMNVALSELPDFTCRPGTAAQDHHGAGIVIGPTHRLPGARLSRCAHARLVAQPVVEMLIPSTLDATLAPPGKHVASLFVQHVAPQLPDGRSWADEAEKEAFADLVIDTVTAHAPNFREPSCAARSCRRSTWSSASAWSTATSSTAQLSLDQLFSARPVPRPRRLPHAVRGLYLCGSGAHPGGGVTGAPGHNAAREIIKDLRRRFRSV